MSPLISFFKYWHLSFECVLGPHVRPSEGEPPTPHWYLWWFGPWGPLCLPAEYRHQEANTWFMRVLVLSRFCLTVVVCIMHLLVGLLRDWWPSCHIATHFRELLVTASNCSKFNLESVESLAAIFVLLQPSLYLLATWEILSVIRFAKLRQFCK